MALQIKGMRKREGPRTALGNGQHFGIEGERFEVEVEVVFTKEIEGMYGTKYLVGMLTPEGFYLKTFSSGRFGEIARKGDSYLIKATVKRHDQYSGRAETEVTRATIIEEL